MRRRRTAPPPPPQSTRVDSDRTGPLPEDWERGDRPVTSYPLNGYLCSICFQPQYDTPSGPVCEGGHGGVEGIEPPHEDDCPVPAQASVDCAPPGSCAVAAAKRGWRPGELQPCQCGGVPDLSIYEHRAATCANGCPRAAKCPDFCDCEEIRSKLKVLREDGHYLGCGEHVRKKCQHTPNGEPCPGDTPDPGQSICYEYVYWICARCNQAEGELEKTCPKGCVEGCQKLAQKPPPPPAEDLGPAHFNVLEAAAGREPWSHPKKPGTGRGATVRFVEVPTTPLVQIENMAQLTGEAPHESVRGAIVKLSPTLPARARESFDGAAHAARLRESGALAVMLSPVIIPEATGGKDSQAVARAASPAEAVAAYFAEVKGVPEDELADAERLALELVEAEGSRG